MLAFIKSLFFFRLTCKKIKNKSFGASCLIPGSVYDNSDDAFWICAFAAFYGGGVQKGL